MMHKHGFYVPYLSHYDLTCVTFVSRAICVVGGAY